MNINIEKSLQDLKEGESKKIQKLEPVKEVKLLMQENAAEDMRILRGLGKNHTLIHAQNEYGKQLELEKFDDEYKGKVFTINQIKKLALDYHLRFLPSTLFTGDMSVEVVAKIREFSKDTKIEINDAVLDRKFYILAPEKMFELQKEIVYRPKPMDPVLFYKIDNEHFRMIHKWGSDFTIGRLISGYKWRNIYNMFYYHMATGFIGFHIILSYLLSNSFLFNYPLIAVGVGIALSFLYAFIRTSPYRDDDGNERSRLFSPESWNSPVKTEYE